MIVLNLKYLAPEVIKKERYDRSVDWWSFGVILYEMLIGIDPFHDNDPMVVYENILNGRFRFPKGFDNAAKSLVKHLLVRDLSKRYGNMKHGVRDIKKHKFFQGIEWELILFETTVMPYIPVVRFQGDTSNFYRYADINNDTGEDYEILNLEEDPFNDW